MRAIDNHVHAGIEPCDVFISGWACIDPWKDQMAIKEAEHTEPEWSKRSPAETNSASWDQKSEGPARALRSARVYTSVYQCRMRRRMRQLPRR